jgi:hypothetical protein
LAAAREAGAARDRTQVAVMGESGGGSRTPRVFGLTIDPDELLARDTYRFGPDLDAEQRLLALARALASSPAWADVEDGIMVVRTQPPMGIALIGWFDPAEAARAEWLPGQLATGLPRLRYVPWAQVEEDCAVLGERLTDRFGSDQLREMTYEAVPRGGFIVLGVLSYVLGLKHDRLTGPPRDGAPVVVVDDVSLTGRRFGEVLGRHAGDVIFAHLYSHPDLRAAIREREASVMDVIAARDLDDFAPEIMGDGYEGWRERWMRRADGACYWTGRPEHVCFPWAEPDFTVWNPVAGREERGWYVVPPSAVLKNRSAGVDGEARVQVQPPSSGPIRVADRTFHGEVDGDVVAANLDTEGVVRLTDVAADIWRVLARSGSLDDAVRALGERFDADPGVLRADAEAVVEDLMQRGLLVAASAESAG